MGHAARGKRRRRRFGRLIKACVAIAILGLTAELGSYVAYRAMEGEWFDRDGLRELLEQRAGRDRVETPDPGAARIPGVVHPYVGYVFDRKADQGRRSTGETVNTLGLVDLVDPIQRRGPGRAVIGVTGGSVAWQMCSFAREALETALGSVPAFAGKEIVVVRMALGAWKQPQQVLVLNWLLSLGAEFDAVINLDGFNEVALMWENLERGISPYFPGRWDAYVRDIPDLEHQRRVGRLVFLESERADAAASFLDSWQRQSAFFSLLWKINDRRRERAIADARASVGNYRPEARPFRIRGPGTQAWTDENTFPRVADMWARSSALLRDLCEARGARYYHFLQPNQYVPDSKPMSEEERSIALGDTGVYSHGVRKGYPHLRDRGRRLVEEGVAFHDLTQMFADVKQRMYEDSCCHFTHEGYAMISYEIARSIAKDDGGQTGHEITALTPVKDSLVLDSPIEPTPVRFEARLASGRVRTIRGHPDLTLTPRDPRIVSASPDGWLTGRAEGKTTVVARLKGLTVQLPVEVRWAELRDLGPAPGHDGSPLTVRLMNVSTMREDRKLVFEVGGPGGAAGGLAPLVHRPGRREPLSIPPPGLLAKLGVGFQLPATRHRDVTTLRLVEFPLPSSDWIGKPVFFGAGVSGPGGNAILSNRLMVTVR